MATKGNSRLLLCVLGAFLAALIGLSAHSVRAAGPVVQNCNDTGTGSLRDAISTAADGDTITFQTSLNCNPISFGSGITIQDKGVTIDATGHTIILDGGYNPATQTGGVFLFSVFTNGSTSSTLNFINLRFQHGNNAGGAIQATRVTVNVTDCLFFENRGNLGGAIFVQSGTTVNVLRSTFNGNTVTTIANLNNGFGGAIFSAGTLTVTNSTFFNNGGDNNRGAGGAIARSGGSLTVTASTIVGNYSGVGGGLWAGGTVTNSIIYGNTAGTGPDAYQGYSSDGTNLIGNTADSSGFGGTDIIGKDPLLAPLGSYSGPTQTMTPLPGSPVIDAIAAGSCATTTDQRGITRPQQTACDIGAAESRGFTLSNATGSGQSANITTAFANPLGLTVTSAFNEPVVGGAVTFTGPATGASIQNSPLGVTITGTGATSPTGTAQATVTANSNGGSNYTVTAHAAGATPDLTFTLSNTIPPLTIGPPSLTAATVGQLYSVQFTASGGTGTGYSFSLIGSAPAGLTFTTNNATLAGTPTQATSASFSIKVTDSGANTATMPYTLTINTANTITIGQNASVPFTTTSQQVTLNATVGTNPAGSVTVNQGTITFTVNQGATTIGTATAANVVNGLASTAYTLPAGQAPGSYQITVQYSGGADFIASSDSTHTLTIRTAVTVTPSSLTAATVGQPYSVQFSASGGTGAGYSFSLTGSLPSSLTFDQNTHTLSGTPTAAASIPFTIGVTDNGGGSGSQAYTLTVNPGSTTTAVTQNVTIPFSTTSQPVSLSATVTTNPSGSVTVSGGTVTFTIMQGPTQITQNTGTVTNGQATASVTIPANQAPGAYTVNALYGGTPDFVASSDTTHTLTIRTAVTVSPPALPHASVGQAYTAQFTGSGGTGTGYTFALTGTLPSPFTFNATTATLSGTSSVVQTITFSISVTDDSGGTGSQAYTLTVDPGSTATAAQNASVPFSANAQSVTLTATVTTSPPGSVTVNEGSVLFTVKQGATTIGTSASATQTNGQASLSYTLPAGTAPGTYTIDAQYSGGTDFVASGDTAHTLTIRPAVAVGPPSLTAATVGQPYSVQFSASGGTGTGYSFSLTGSAPASLSFNAATATLAGTPTTAGGAQFTIVATDSSSATGSQPYTLSVNPAAVAVAAQNITSPFSTTSQQVTLTATVAITPASTLTVNAGTVTFTVQQGATIIGSATPANVVNGTAASAYTLPANTAPGQYTIVATYNGTANFQGGTDTTHTLTVQQAVTLGPGTLPDGTVGSAYSQTITATGGTGSGYTFTLTNGAPPQGLTLGTDGKLTGTPMHAATATFTVQAADSGTNTGSKQFTVKIGPATTTTAATATQNITIPFSATNQTVNLTTGVAIAPTSPLVVNAGTVTFTIKQGATTIGSATTATVTNGQATATYTIPGNTTMGNYTITAAFGGTADFQASVDTAHSLTIAPATLTVNPTTLPDGTAGAPYTTQIGASGGNGAYTFAVTAGTLPQGITLGTDGKLTGTPAATGQATITVTATDGAGNAGSRQYTLVINAAPLRSIVVTLTHGGTTLKVGETQPLTATGIYADGSQKDLTGSVLWQTSNPTFASLNGGAVTGKAPTASVTITASIVTSTTGTQATISGNITLTIAPGAPVGIQPAPGGRPAGASVPTAPAASPPAPAPPPR